MKHAASAVFSMMKKMFGFVFQKYQTHLHAKKMTAIDSQQLINRYETA